MPAKRKRPPAKKKLTKTILDMLPKNEVEYLERLIELSERQVTGQSENLDKFFTNQVDRLRQEIRELKKK